MKTFHAELVELCGGPVRINRVRIESYMGKVQEEGCWVVFTLRGDMWLEIAKFTLICMPGCCGIVISTNASVAADFRRRGIGTLLNHLRRQMAWLLGYGLIMCTDVESNEPQQRILENAGWTQLYTFKNPRTPNNVSIHAYELVDLHRALGFDMYTYTR